MTQVKFGCFTASRAAAVYKGVSTKTYRGDGITSKCAVYLRGFIGDQQADQGGAGCAGGERGWGGGGELWGRAVRACDKGVW